LRGGEQGLPVSLDFVPFANPRKPIRILKSDKRAIFSAAAAAQKCADYILAFHPDFAASTAHDQDNEPQEDECSRAA